MTWLGRRHRVALTAPPSGAGSPATGDHPDALAAPMPGRIVRVHVEPGDHVRGNAPLVILEAMKMEHALSLPVAVKVKAVHVSVRMQVSPGHLLLEFDPI